MYNVLGNFKLDIDYDVESTENNFELVRLSISPHEEKTEMISFNLEEEMEEIIKECIKDFTIQKELMETGKEINISQLSSNKDIIILACSKYDFSAN